VAKRGPPSPQTPSKQNIKEEDKNTILKNLNVNCRSNGYT